MKSGVCAVICFFVCSAIILAIVLPCSALRTVKPGEVGIVSVFGKVWENTYESGLHLTHPSAKMHTFSLQTQTLSAEEHMPTRDGLTVTISLTLLFKIANKTSARGIFINLGENYITNIIEPYLKSEARAATSAVPATDLFATDKRNKIATTILNSMQERMEPRGLFMEDVALRGVTLPSIVQTAVEAKLAAEQESERMTFVLAKEQQEAERKGIEAEGIAAFQRTVSTNITSFMLKWKGIEATETLANSANTKIVVIGSAETGGLPLIMPTEEPTNNTAT
jgi:prohibitin 1